MGNWQTPNNLCSFFSIINNIIIDNDNKDVDLLPNLKVSPSIFIGVDTSGEHKLAKCQVISFILCDMSKLGEWFQTVSTIREIHRLGNRIISYKKLSDIKRFRALNSFLISANNLQGILITIAIDKSIDSLFEPDGWTEFASQEPDIFGIYKRPSLEKFMRIVHFGSFFCAGLAGTNQDILWISDEDDILPNDKRILLVREIIAGISGSYFNSKMGHLRYGVSRSPQNQKTEDLLSIADLAGGAIADHLTDIHNNMSHLQRNIITIGSTKLPNKAKLILSWFMEKGKPFKRLLFYLGIDDTTKKYTIKLLNLHKIPHFTISTMQRKKPT